MPNPIYVRDQYCAHQYLIREAFGQPYLVDADSHTDALERYAEDCAERGFDGIVMSWERCCEDDPEFEQSQVEGTSELHYTESGYLDTTYTSMIEDPSRQLLIDTFADTKADIAINRRAAKSTSCVVQRLVEDALSNGPVMLRPHSTNPAVIRDMIERSGLDRRTTKRADRPRRKDDQ